MPAARLHHSARLVISGSLCFLCDLTSADTVANRLARRICGPTKSGLRSFQCHIGRSRAAQHLRRCRAHIHTVPTAECVRLHVVRPLSIDDTAGTVATCRCQRQRCSRLVTGHRRRTQSKCSGTIASFRIVTWRFEFVRKGAGTKGKCLPYRMQIDAYARDSGKVLFFFY